MLAETPKKSVKTLREVIIDIIAKRSTGAPLGEIMEAMNSCWRREDGKMMLDGSVLSHLRNMSKSGVLRFEERPSRRPGGKVLYYFLNHPPKETDKSKIRLISTEQAPLKQSLPALNWTPPRQHIPRRPNPLHQVGGAA